MITKYISWKQYGQIIRLCGEFQPFIEFDTIAFLDLVDAARLYCDRSYYPFIDKDRFKKLLIDRSVKEIRDKYYFLGFGGSNKSLSARQLKMIFSYTPRIKSLSFGFNDMSTYKPVESILWVKVVRACRDFMRSKMSKEAEVIFKERLDVIYNAFNHGYI